MIEASRTTTGMINFHDKSCHIDDTICLEEMAKELDESKSEFDQEVMLVLGIRN